MQQQPSHNPADDLTYQTEILPGVSRTFALTIPQLPLELDRVVTNAYLLCRLADTIEDDVGPTEAQKSEFHHRFVAVVQGDEPAAPFAGDLSSVLSSQVLAAERELVENTARVIRVTHGFSAAEQAALSRCVSIMCRGMPEFQRNKSLNGLPEALRDRFDSTLEVVQPHPEAIAALHEPLRSAALRAFALESDRRVSLRNWLSIQRLLPEFGLRGACIAVLGQERGSQIHDAIVLADADE